MNNYLLYRSAHVTYLRVAVAELQQLGLEQEISAFSRTDGDWVYLDCEVDIPRYLHRKLGTPLLSGEFNEEQINKQRKFFAHCEEAAADEVLLTLPPYSITHLTLENHVSAITPH